MDDSSADRRLAGGRWGLTAQRAAHGLAGVARCSELAILTAYGDALTMHRTNHASRASRNSYIRHKSEFRIMPENFTIRHTAARIGAAVNCLTGWPQKP